jgi:hypothetical protein
MRPKQFLETITPAIRYGDRDMIKHVFSHEFSATWFHVQFLRAYGVY